MASEVGASSVGTEAEKITFVWSHEEVKEYKAPSATPSPVMANPWAAAPKAVALPASVANTKVVAPPKWPAFLPADWSVGKRRLPGGSYHSIYVKPGGTHFYWQTTDVEKYLAGTKDSEGCPLHGYQRSDNDRAKMREGRIRGNEEKRVEAAAQARAAEECEKQRLLALLKPGSDVAPSARPAPAAVPAAAAAKETVAAAAPSSKSKRGRSPATSSAQTLQNTAPEAAEARKRGRGKSTQPAEPSATATQTPEKKQLTAPGDLPATEEKKKANVGKGKATELTKPSVGQAWMYKPPNGKPIDIRTAPQISAPRSTHRLQPNEVFHSSVEVTGAADGILYMMLADGRGWIFESKPNVGTMCVRQ